jgi:hypothetical protein
MTPKPAAVRRSGRILTQPEISFNAVIRLATAVVVDGQTDAEFAAVLALSAILAALPSDDPAYLYIPSWSPLVSGALILLSGSRKRGRQSTQDKRFSWVFNHMPSDDRYGEYTMRTSGAPAW